MSAPVTLPAVDRAALVELRRDLHRHPEFGADRLEAFGYAGRRGVGRTGVLAQKSGGAAGRCVLLRADMDALPVDEADEDALVIGAELLSRTALGFLGR